MAISFGGWIRKYSHWIGFVGTAVGVLGILLGFYFYIESRQIGEISFKFRTVKFFDRNTPGIKVLDQAGHQITDNVFGFEIILWNSGNISLGEKSDRIREPITMLISENARIIDAVVQDTRNVSKDVVKIERNDSSVSVHWVQFDPGDAIKAFVIYSSREQSPVSYRGRFVQTQLNNTSDWSEAHPGAQSLIAALWLTLSSRPLSSLILLLVSIAPMIIMPLVIRLRWNPIVIVVTFAIAMVSAFSALVAGLIRGSAPF